jgi:hypothetical protein
LNLCVLNVVPLIEQVSVGYGPITAHALMSLEARGTLFVSPGMEVGANPFCYFMYYMLYYCMPSFWITFLIFFLKKFVSPQRKSPVTSSITVLSATDWQWVHWCPYSTLKKLNLEKLNFKSNTFLPWFFILMFELCSSTDLGV